MSSYEPNVWAKGDVVTSAKLNHIENGIKTAGQIVFIDLTFTESEYEAPKFTCTKTWQEVYDIASSGAFVVFKVVSESLIGIIAYAYLQQCLYIENTNEYFISCSFDSQGIQLFADTPDDYPATQSIT